MQSLDKSRYVWITMYFRSNPFAHVAEFAWEIEVLILRLILEEIRMKIGNFLQDGERRVFVRYVYVL